MEGRKSPYRTRLVSADTRGFERAVTMPIGQEDLDTPKLGAMTRKGTSETIDSGVFSMHVGFGDETPDGSEEARWPTPNKRESHGPINVDLEKGGEKLHRVKNVEPEIDEGDQDLFRKREHSEMVSKK
jgi:hypothetical protein